MKILDRYIIREFLKVFGLCLCGFILVFLLIEITDKIKFYFDYNPPGILMCKYFLVKLPGYLFYAGPLSILMGGMLSLLMLARNSEIIAMQANGVDALMVAYPALMLGAAATAIMFIANESVIPWSNRYSEYIQNVEIAKKPDTVYFKRDQIWMRVPDAIIQIGRFDKNTQSLERVTVITVDSEFNMVERLFADRAKWWGDHWIMYGVNRTYRIEPGRYGVETLPSLPAPFYKAPKDFDRVESPTKEMNLSQLGDYIEKLTAEGQSPVRHLTDWHDKIAFPFVCLIMAALGIPFAIRMHPRSGGVAVGLGLSLLTAFGWWITHTFFIALGHGGYIPPALAAWGPNAIFGFSALYLILSAGA